MEPVEISELLGDPSDFSGKPVLIRAVPLVLIGSPQQYLGSLGDQMHAIDIKGGVGYDHLRSALRNAAISVEGVFYHSAEQTYVQVARINKV